MLTSTWRAPQNFGFVTVYWQPVGLNPVGNSTDTIGDPWRKVVDWGWTAGTIYLSIVCVYVARLWLLITNTKSAVYMMNSIGPNTDPCGTPHTSATTIDLASPRRMYCDYPSRCDWNHWTMPAVPTILLRCWSFWPGTQIGGNNTLRQLRWSQQVNKELSKIRFIPQLFAWVVFESANDANCLHKLRYSCKLFAFVSAWTHESNPLCEWLSK